MFFGAVMVLLVLVARRLTLPPFAPARVSGDRSAVVVDRVVEEAGAADGVAVLPEPEETEAQDELAASRRLDERGDAHGAFNLGSLLAEQGDLDGAVAAYHRAIQRGDREVAALAWVALDSLGNAAR